MARNTRRRSYPLSTWTKLMMDGATTLAASQEVIARRLWLMSTFSQTSGPFVVKEMQRMGSEKVHSGIESAGAMAVRAAMAGMQIGSGFWSSLMSPIGPRSGAKSLGHISDATAKILHSGLTPIRKRARSNAARLRRT